jgi:hypothetical protein
MRTIRSAWLAGAFALFSTGACAAGGTAVVSPSFTAPPPSQWAEPPAYTYVLTTGCTRGFVDARFRVEVRDGVVVSATALNEQARLHPDYHPPTLGDLSDWIATDSRLRRQTDPVDGHPLAFGFDAAAMAVDTGECYAVSKYGRN